MATIEFGDFSCAEFGDFTDHTSTIPETRSCSIFPETGSVKSFTSSLSQSFNFDQNSPSVPDPGELNKKSNGLEGKFVFSSILELGFSQNQIAKLTGMHVHKDFITHLSLTNEGMSSMQNLSIPSLTSLSFFPEKTNSFELDLSVANDFPNNTQNGGNLELENSHFLLDLSLPMKEVKSEEPSKVISLDEDLLSLNFGGLETMEEKTNNQLTQRENCSIEASDKFDEYLEPKKVQISKETEAIIQSLPDLSYLMSKVLVFPIDKKISV